MTFEFDPPDGYRNIARFPTTPASEAEFRDSMQSLLDQLLDELNKGGSSAIGIQAMSRQALINGNFEVWQRGTSFTNPTNLQYIIDRWRVHTGTGAPTNVIHSRQMLNSGELPGSYYFYRVNVDGAGVSPSDFRTAQLIENGVRFLCGAGKKVTVSFWARSSIVGKKIGIYPAQNYGGGGSAQEFINGTNLTLTPEWKKYTLTFDTNTLNGKVIGDGDFLSINIQYAWDSSLQNRVGASVPETFVGAGNIDLTQIQFNSGGAALPFQPRSFGEELALCQRYYEKSYSLADFPGTATDGGAIFGVTQDGTNSGAHYATTTFKVRKRVSPTVTIYGTGGTVNTVSDNGVADRQLATGSFAYASESSMRHDYALAGATSARRKFHFVADAEL